MSNVQAKLRYLRISPKKVRLLANLIKGMTVERAEAELKARKNRSAISLLNLLKSAISNAVNVHKIDRQTLLVKSVRVDPGPAFKRILPRAMGRATPIWKRTSHITLVLESKEDLKSSVSGAFSKTQATTKAESPEIQAISTKRSSFKEAAKKESRVKPTRGFIPKIFQRKAI